MPTSKFELPFSKAAAELLKDMTLEDLAEDPMLEEVRKLARERLMIAIRGKGFHAERSQPLEVYSFVAAKLIAAAAGRNVLARLANYEAKRFMKKCQSMSLDQLRAIARELGIELKGDGELWMDLASYLRGASKIGGARWRLVNRVVSRGFVLIDEYELGRILAEYVRENVMNTPQVELPDRLKRIADEISEISSRSRRPVDTKGDELPPCIEELVEKVKRGENVSHQARFTLASFLLSRGWKEERVIDLFRSLPDFSEKVTTYQVSHIAKRRYKPPSCDTMREWGLCPGDCGRRRV
ncbi:MAG: hypothetical protein LM591_02200 [Candidatus Korarchaeum sp.]|nr:hypothetical protein [Candidatus Korarchaeum sp.]